jgi:hypothetical protein
MFSPTAVQKQGQTDVAITQRADILEFRWECINKYLNVLLIGHLDILYNENQLDTLFILNLFRQSIPTCFGHVYCPSSGGLTVYVHETCKG